MLCIEKIEDFLVLGLVIQRSSELRAEGEVLQEEMGNGTVVVRQSLDNDGDNEDVAAQRR